MRIKFFWNGIRVDGSRKLIKCHYGIGPYHPKSGLDPDTITIYAKDVGQPLPSLLDLPIENNSDSRTDYFEKDRIRVPPTSPHYSNVLKAFRDQEAHFETKLKSLFEQIGGE